MAAARQAAPTWYEVLGVPQTASADAIKQAFRAAALRLHPDKQQGGGGGGSGGEPAAAADAEYLRVQQAWEVLQDGERRAAYDRQLALLAAAADVHVNETVPLAALAPEEVDGQRVLAWPCRCGGAYYLLLEDAAALQPIPPAAAAAAAAEALADVQATAPAAAAPAAAAPEASELLVPCSTCSLHVRVVAQGA